MMKALIGLCCWLLVSIATATTDHLKRPRQQNHKLPLRRLREREQHGPAEHGQNKENNNLERMEEYSLYYKLVGFGQDESSMSYSIPTARPVQSPTKMPTTTTTTTSLPTKLPTVDNNPTALPTTAPAGFGGVTSPPIGSTTTPIPAPPKNNDQPSKAPKTTQAPTDPNSEPTKSPVITTFPPAAGPPSTTTQAPDPNSETTKSPVTSTQTLEPNNEPTKSPVTSTTAPAIGSPSITAPTKNPSSSSSCPTEEQEDAPKGSEEWQPQVSIPGPTGARWGWSADISSDASTIVAAGYLGSTNETETGIVGTYTLQDAVADPIGQVGGKSAGEQFGNTVSMSEDGRLFAVGAHNANCARIYRTDDSHLIDEIKVDGTLTNVGLSKDGTKAVVLTDNVARVYQVSYNNSELLGSPLLTPDTGDPFGKSWDLSEDGEILVVGGKAANANTGYAKAYKFNGTEWEPLGEDLIGTSSEDYFGAAASLSANGKRLAIGARQQASVDGIAGSASGEGYVKVFDFNGTGWNQVGETLTGQSQGDQFSADVSLSDDGKHLVVGANAGGYVRVYREVCDEWIPLGGITSSSQDEFGYSVGISNDGETFIATSFPYPDASLPGGAVDVFRLVDL